MAEGEGRWGRLLASVRVRTTAAAVTVVAIALCLGAVVFVLLVRDSLRDGVESSAEQQLGSLVQQVERSGVPGPGTETDDEDDPEDTVWQVLDRRGDVVADSQPLSAPLPTDEDEVRLPGADHAHLLVRDDAEAPDGQDHEVVVGVSLEDVDESTSAILGPLLVGLPVLLLLVGATTWLVVTRALSPVERIRREVEQISGDRLDRRVPVPRSRDEVHRLASTMNQMLTRLQDSRDRQQQFVGDASHELRSPLAAIRQTAEVARAHPGALPEGELAEAVLEESLRMQRLVEQMLVLTRADSTQGSGLPMESVDLADVVRAEIETANSDGSGGSAVDGAAVGSVVVRGNRIALGQVVRNLLDNATRHARSSVSLTLHQADGRGELVVEDDGAGVAPVDRERIFHRFVRLDEARARDAGGSGLGLAIVRDVVRAHGGTVTVTDSAHGGARFVVRLPADGAGSPS